MQAALGESFALYEPTGNFIIGIFYLFIMPRNPYIVENLLHY